MHQIDHHWFDAALALFAGAPQAMLLFQLLLEGKCIGLRSEV
tara:strand:+ start:737 stop:862 length:126 start_codon:yes stop_codon:yes gene_type:complete